MGDAFVNLRSATTSVALESTVYSLKRASHAFFSPPSLRVIRSSMALHPGPPPGARRCRHPPVTQVAGQPGLVQPLASGGAESSSDSLDLLVHRWRIAERSQPRPDVNVFLAMDGSHWRPASALSFWLVPLIPSPNASMSDRRVRRASATRCMAERLQASGRPATRVLLEQTLKWWSTSRSPPPRRSRTGLSRTTQGSPLHRAQRLRLVCREVVEPRLKAHPLRRPASCSAP